MNDTSLGQKLNTVIQSTNLVDIYLKSCNTESHVPARSVEPMNTILNFDRETQHIVSSENDVLVCFATLKIRADSKKVDDKESTHLFDISATYTLIYKLSGATLDQQALKIFASQNAYYNAYPYLREIVQSMCARMEIEPVKLPLLKPLTKKEIDQFANSQ